MSEIVTISLSINCQLDSGRNLSNSQSDWQDNKRNGHIYLCVDTFLHDTSNIKIIVLYQRDCYLPLIAISDLFVGILLVFDAAFPKLCEFHVPNMLLDGHYSQIPCS